MTSTDLSRGIVVKIDQKNLDLLKNKHSGFLPVDCYPEYFLAEGIIPNEQGRFLMFRFILEDEKPISKKKT